METVGDAAIEVLVSAQLVLESDECRLRAPRPWLAGTGSPRRRHGRKPHSSSSIPTWHDRISAADRSFISCPIGLRCAGRTKLAAGKTRICIRSGSRFGLCRLGVDSSAAAGIVRGGLRLGIDHLDRGRFDGGLRLDENRRVWRPRSAVARLSRPTAAATRRDSADRRRSRSVLRAALA